MAVFLRSLLDFCFISLSPWNLAPRADITFCPSCFPQFFAWFCYLSVSPWNLAPLTMIIGASNPISSATSRGAEVPNKHHVAPFGGGCPLFSRSKITPEIDHVFHRFWKPKGSQNPSQNHLKSIPGAIPKPTPKKSQNYTEPNPSQPWKSTSRAHAVLVFTYSRFPTKKEKMVHKPPKSIPKTIQNP